MKRVRVNIEDIVNYQNIMVAVYKASKGRRKSKGVERFFRDFDKSVEKLIEDLISFKAPYGNYKKMIIFDPKKRYIHIPCFEDRIIHHAIFNKVGIFFDKSMIFHSYASIKNRGPVKLIEQVQKNIGKYPWFCKGDILKYFDSINHNVLKELLRRKFKGVGFFNLVDKIIDSYHTSNGRGMPIGSLTSQYFANFYLSKLDRFLEECCNVFGYTRYMDDILFFTKDKNDAKRVLKECKCFVKDILKLELKDSAQINKTGQGVTYCGHRVLPNMIRLTHRKMKSFKKHRYYWENTYKRGLISGVGLQNVYSAVFGIVSNADSLGWRKKQLTISPAIDI